MPQDIQSTQTLSFEVKPPEDSGLLPQQFLDFAPQSQERFELILKPSVEMKGLLQKHDETGMLALVIATPTTGIPGRSQVISTTTDDMGYFQFNLVEDIDYRWSIYPENSAYAPLFLSEMKAVAQSDWGEPIVFPAPETLRLIKGRLVASDANDSSTSSVAGMQVRVFSGERLISSAARSNDNGDFEIHVPEGDFENLKLEILPVEEDSLWPISFVEDFALDDVVDLGDINLGTWPDLIDANILVLTTEGEPEVGAKVYVSGTMGKGTFQQLLATNETGQMNAMWPDIIYDIAVVPAPTSTVAVKILNGIRFSELDGGLTVHLGARQSIQGVVWSPSGPPVGGSTLEFTRKSGENGTNPAVIEKTSWAFETLSDTDGNYGLTLDPGTYSVTLVPPPGSTLPVYVQEIIVSDDLSLLDFVFPEPQVISGSLSHPDGETSLDLTTIQAFQAGNGDESGTSQQFRWLGETLTDAIGNFDILIPQ
tara:strand:+ start:2067 stop:3509 length:1443 start_codon:yes stop_codon:yes gene_type:complete